MTTVATLPPGPLLLIANEFLDALPIRQFVRGADGWHERRVGLDADGGLPSRSIRAPTRRAALPASARRRRDRARRGPAAVALARRPRRAARAPAAAPRCSSIMAMATAPAATRCRRCGAIARHAVLDRARQRRSHRACRFRRLRRRGRIAGARAWGPVTQGAFLRRARHRGARRARSPAHADADAGATRSAAAAAASSIRPAMGRLFKVLALTPSRRARRRQGLAHDAAARGARAPPASATASSPAKAASARGSSPRSIAASARATISAHVAENRAPRARRAGRSRADRARHRLSGPWRRRRDGRAAVAARGPAARRRAGDDARRAWRSASSPPIARRCCSPTRVPASSPPRMPAGAARWAACSRRRSRRWSAQGAEPRAHPRRHRPVHRRRAPTRSGRNSPRPSSPRIRATRGSSRRAAAGPLPASISAAMSRPGCAALGVAVDRAPAATPAPTPSGSFPIAAPVSPARAVRPSPFRDLPRALALRRICAAIAYPPPMRFCRCRAVPAAGRLPAASASLRGHTPPPSSPALRAARQRRHRGRSRSTGAPDAGRSASRRCDGRRRCRTATCRPSTAWRAISGSYRLDTAATTTRSARHDRASPSLGGCADADGDVVGSGRGRERDVAAARRGSRATPSSRRRLPARPRRRSRAGRRRCAGADHRSRRSVAVDAVTGAPGDGGTCAGAVRSRRRCGAPASTSPTAGRRCRAFMLSGRGRDRAGGRASRTSSMRWALTRADGGARSARSSRRTRSPAGSLDGAWGDIAYDVASAAAPRHRRARSSAAKTGAARLNAGGSYAAIRAAAAVYSPGPLCYSPAALAQPRRIPDA